jgi:nitric oxide reductase subunit B
MDYTAEYLLRVGQVAQQNIAEGRVGKPCTALGDEEQGAVNAAMQRDLKGVDLSGDEARLSAAVAGAITTLKAEIARATGLFPTACSPIPRSRGSA